MSAPRWPGRTAFRTFAVWTFSVGLCAIWFRLMHGWRRDRRSGTLPDEGAILYVANHQSFYDPPLVGCQIKRRPCAFLARATLFDNPFFGRLITFLGSIPLEGGGRGAGALRAAMKELEAGRGVLLFPEGARTKTGATQRFSPGAMLLIRRTKPWVVPVAVEGVHDAYPRGGRPRLFSPVATRAGEPIPAAELLAVSTEDALDRLEQEVERLRLELREELRGRTRGRVPASGPGDEAITPRSATPDSADEDTAAAASDAD